ncbi:MAG: hypothetical protein HQK88_04595 [Nitrospirae bacterium]|nr:hypothetical protein [Nitrospirota bacterium]MBF0533392.1 hypothetical protein [Nitrospirota bacterium]MBF0616082.1 hypothetical protein [Nitrospirota bacterium]
MSLDKTNHLDINRVVLLGRVFDEYYHMFNLRDISQSDTSILDVASGVSSFCAEANAKGYNVTASDVIYNHLPEEIYEKGLSDVEEIMKKMPSVAHNYNWEYFKDIDALKATRLNALTLFIEDYKEFRNKRYLNVEYPFSNFLENQFDITLVSHFLFLYEDLLDYKFHKDTIKELAKITKNEIRIFPLVNLQGITSRYISQLMSDIELQSLEFTIIKTDYSFIKNGNEMLAIRNTLL